jgi:hypothetical protein
MAKEREKKLAFEYYVNQKKTAKDTALQVGVTEKTIGEWIRKSNWKKIQEARVNSKEEQLDNIREVISILTNDRIAIQKEIDQINETILPLDEKKESIMELRKQAASVSDEISKWNKTLENIDKENRISISVYLEVMEDIFNNLKENEPSLYTQTLDFQERHLQHISTKYN